MRSSDFKAAYAPSAKGHRSQVRTCTSTMITRWPRPTVLIRMSVAAPAAGECFFTGTVMTGSAWPGTIRK